LTIDLGLNGSDFKYLLSGISRNFWCLLVCKISAMIHPEILEYLFSKEMHQKSKVKQKSHIDHHRTISVKRFTEVE